MDDPPNVVPPPIITKEAQATWFALPADVPLHIALTRNDLDNLFLSIRESILAQADLAGTIVALSNGKTDDAQTLYNQSKDHLNAALAYIDFFIVHAMTTAKPVQNG